MCHLYPYNNVKLLRKFFFTLIQNTTIAAARNHKFHGRGSFHRENGTPLMDAATWQRRQTNEQTDRQTDGQQHRVKPRFAAGA